MLIEGVCISTPLRNLLGDLGARGVAHTTYFTLLRARNGEAEYTSNNKTGSEELAIESPSYLATERKLHKPPAPTPK